MVLALEVPVLGATSRDHDTCRGWRWDKEQRDEGQRLGQRPTASGRGRGRSQSSDILSFNGLKATEIPHRKRKGKRKGLGQMRVPCCLSVCLSGQTRHTETLVLRPLAWLF